MISRNFCYPSSIAVLYDSTEKWTPSTTPFDSHPCIGEEREYIRDPIRRHDVNSSSYLKQGKPVLLAVVYCRTSTYKVTVKCSRLFLAPLRMCQGIECAKAYQHQKES